MELRPYQLEAISLVREQFKKHKRVALVLPTGSGKTICFSEIAKASYEKDKSVLILTHRRELLRQASKVAAFGCTIAMVETLKNKIKRGYNVNDFDLLIIDEMHIGSFRAVLDVYTNYVLGCTATPLAKPSLSLTYNEIVCNVGVSDLIDQGFLSKPKTFVKTNVDLSKLKIKSGEYTPQSLGELYNRPKIYAGVVDDYVNEYNGVKAICFCCSIEHAQNTHKEFLDRSVKSFCVDSKMDDKDRDEQMKLFSESSCGVLCNMGIATTGTDIPDIRLVILNRATKSLVLYLQMIGRGSRVTPDKNTFTILDYGSNVLEHGHYQADRPWREIFFKKKKEKQTAGAAPTKVCSVCSYVCFASARVCENCGHIFDSKTIPIDEGLLIEMEYKKVEGKRLYDLTVEELMQVAKLKGWKSTFLDSVLFHKDMKLLDRYWDIKGYQPGYRYKRLSLMAGSSPCANFFIKK